MATGVFFIPSGNAVRAEHREDAYAVLPLHVPPLFDHQFLLS